MGGGSGEVGALIRHRFARSEPRKHAVDYVQGLLSGEERMSSWTLSERAGDRLPDGMQRLLSTEEGPPPGRGAASTRGRRAGSRTVRSGCSRAVPLRQVGS